MASLDFSKEIIFQTTRSGGKGGQHVNKVETAVMGFLYIGSSQLLSEEEKQVILQKLSKRITSEGALQVKAQTYRSQLKNKMEAARKINLLVQNALKKRKKRVPTKVSKAEKEIRLKTKKRKAEIKLSRKKYYPDDV